MAQTLDTLRVGVKAAEAVRGTARLRALAELRRRVQEVEDLELLATLERVSAYKVAAEIGITPPSVYGRAKKARERVKARERAERRGEPYHANAPR